MADKQDRVVSWPVAQTAHSNQLACALDRHTADTPPLSPECTGSKHAPARGAYRGCASTQHTCGTDTCVGLCAEPAHSHTERCFPGLYAGPRHSQKYPLVSWQNCQGIIAQGYSVAVFEYHIPNILALYMYGGSGRVLSLCLSLTLCILLLLSEARTRLHQLRFSPDALCVRQLASCRRSRFSS